MDAQKKLRKTSDYPYTVGHTSVHTLEETMPPAAWSRPNSPPNGGLARVRQDDCQQPFCPSVYGDTRSRRLDVLRRPHTDYCRLFPDSAGHEVGAYR
jgi:hypothetical protein